MKNKSLSIICLTIIICLVSSCNAYVKKSTGEGLNIDTHEQENILKNTEEDVESIDFRIDYSVHGLCTMRIEAPDDCIEFYNIGIDGTHYQMFRDKSICIYSETVNRLIDELVIEGIDSENNIIDRKVFNNLYIYNAENSDMLSFKDNNALSVELLYIINADNLESLDGIEDLKNLKSLKLENSFVLNDITALSMATTLERIDISDGIQTSSLSAMEELTQLKELKIRLSDVQEEQSVYNQNVISKLLNLEILELNNMQFKNLDFLEPLVYLKKLKVEQNNQSCDYHNIGKIGELKEISIVGNSDYCFHPNINDFGSIETVIFTYANLQNTCFEIENNISVIELDHCSNVCFCNQTQLNKLKKLCLNATQITNLACVFDSNLEKLSFENLDIDGFNFAGLSQNTQMILGNDLWHFYDINLDESEKKQVISLVLQYPDEGISLEGFDNLEYLYLYGIYDNGEYSELIRSIGGLEKLEELIIMETETKDYSFLNDLKELRQLSISGCYGDLNLDFLGLNQLEYLMIQDHFGEVRFNNTLENKELRQLELRDVDLNNFASFNSLESLLIINQRNINLDYLLECESLKYVFCKEINLNSETIDLLTTKGILVDFIN